MPFFWLPVMGDTTFPHFSSTSVRFLLLVAERLCNLLQSIRNVLWLGLNELGESDSPSWETLGLRDKEGNCCLVARNGTKWVYGNMELTLVEWLSWFKRYPIYQKVVGFIPSQGTYLGCGFNPRLGLYGRQPIKVSLITLMFLSLSLPLPPSLPSSLSKINKYIFR